MTGELSLMGKVLKVRGTEKKVSRRTLQLHRQVGGIQEKALPWGLMDRIRL